jgi:DNA-3-methyladenine glycosylase I
VNEVPDGIVVGDDGRARCWWASGDPLYRPYHDDEWGHPVDDDTRLFEKLCLEGFQSGLSWLTILRKRDNFRRAFDGFEPRKVAGYDDRDVERLLADAGIVRHRGKILATITNAQRYLTLAKETGSLAAYLWSFEPEPSARPARLDRDALMTLDTTPESTALSKDLRRRGWAFVGPTTVYAAMQAMGIVNDHVEGCFARPIVEAERARFERPTR